MGSLKGGLLMTHQKNILILKGSPRQNGNSAILADVAAAGAGAAGALVESFFLQGMHIEPCSACEVCHEVTEGECNIEDDMQTLYPHIRRADAILIASPVYWFTMSAQIKLVIDRWYALETSRGNALKGKKFGIILTYGDTSLETSGGINAVHTFEHMFRYIGCEIVGIVHGSANRAGEISRQPALLEQAKNLGHKLAEA
jgi:multimeric flavodoxin WrbA